MSKSIGIELQFFLASILCGGMLVLVYDILRIFRRIIKHTGFFVAVEDILFWIGSSVVIFIMMYQQNNGIIRGFSIMGMVLGMIVYNQILSSLLVGGITFIIRRICWLFKNVLQIILKPFLITFRFIFGILRKFMKVVLRKNKKVRNNFVKRLKNIFKTVKMIITKD